MQRPFAQVDVFTTGPGLGNPLAVVLDGSGLTTEEMLRFARWTNLSETTFLLPPDDPRADYRVRVFTPDAELPFAGHPTLGSCHAWLEAGGVPRDPSRVIQECGAGLVDIRRDGNELAFAAPPLLRSGPVDEAELVGIAATVGLPRTAIVDAQWGDNGPGWVMVLLESAAAVLAVRPGAITHDLGILGLYPPGSPVALEVRALYPQNGYVVEDPVTGSLNASAAGWLLGSARLTAPYTASQGGAIGRAGRISITQDADGTVWTGGGSVTVIAGTVDL
ncbi:MAG TPA: PhzF family phenazine biosynthesis protein [Candidatus Limnocylindrales bacterium]|nr:PhzF family phenazine biosynthesis protein [Candidatus Limnocylindrales bacterium]